MIYWTFFQINEQHYTLAATERGLCFFGNDFQNETQFLQWAAKKGWSHLVAAKQQLLPAIEQITAYMEKKQTQFTLKLDLQGTAFQQLVWEALCTIPYGQTVSYSDIAQKINKPSAVRAVAAAIGANPVMIIVPCHRVIGKNGKLTGFRGGLDLKKVLLQLEGAVL